MGRAAVFICAVALFAVLLLTTQYGEAAPLKLRAPRSLKQLGLRNALQTSSSGGETSSFTCDVCKVFIGLIQELFLQNRTEDEIVSIVTAVCIDLKIEDVNVCTLVVKEFKDEFLTVLDRVGLSAKEICGAIFGHSCAADYNPFDQPWNISIPGNKPPVTPVPPPKPGLPTIRILHISDMHYDRYYTPGLSNDCGEPLCCRPPNKKGNASTAAAYWGDYNCDVPYHTQENLMQFVAGMKDKFDWVYWTGDLPAHNIWNQSRVDQLYVLDKMCALMKQYLPDKLVLSTLGNHESVPVDSFPPPYITGYQSNNWLLNAAADQWSIWLSKLPGWSQTEATIKKGGFYSVKIREDLRVISLQTNYANSNNHWLLINSTDPAGQLAWLVQQLMAAEANGEKVHIIGHIPPSGMMKWFSWNYHDIVNRFESTIVGQFFGHTHKDSFQVFYDDNNVTRATNVAYLGPSVTTYQGLNLGFRIYTIDGQYNGTTYATLDHESYYLNLTDANLSNKPNWQFEYSAKGDYGLKALQPADWDDLISRFKEDNELFQKYYQYRSKMHASPCDATCKAQSICSLKRTRPDDPEPCNDILPEGFTVRDIELYDRKQQMC